MKSLNGLCSFQSLNLWYSQWRFVRLASNAHTNLGSCLFSCPNTCNILPIRVKEWLERSREGNNLKVANEYSLIEHKSEFYKSAWVQWHHLVFGPQLPQYQIDDVISGHKADSCPQPSRSLATVLRHCKNILFLSALTVIESKKWSLTCEQWFDPLPVSDFF